MEDKKFVAITKEQIKKFAIQKACQQNQIEVALIQTFINVNDLHYVNFWTVSGYIYCSNGPTDTHITVWDSSKYYQVYATHTAFLLYDDRSKQLSLDLSKEWVQTQYNAYGESYLDVAKKSLEDKKAEHKKAIKQIDKQLDLLKGLQSGPAKGNL